MLCGAAGAVAPDEGERRSTGFVEMKAGGRGIGTVQHVRGVCRTRSRRTNYAVASDDHTYRVSVRKEGRASQRGVFVGRGEWILMDSDGWRERPCRVRSIQTGRATGPREGVGLKETALHSCQLDAIIYIWRGQNHDRLARLGGSKTRENRGKGQQSSITAVFR
ncbi:hypothetical protein LX32DRAFT_100126 [Colletotrichum zoysiae]|uniref:Uncharacterized protein n=1 Tax=Colletotrichum zoysiae TaxID=1216348 RepID=A0AAD9H8M3_9PEZI|nr:hypothetical protein LX32DRAFT_100126 [Colletotrichum zoysiae]